MKILKIFMLASVFCLFSSVIEAKSLNEKYPSLYNTEWQKKLKLTEYQIEQINAIREKNQEQMNVYLMEMDTLKHEMAALVDDVDEQIREVLTEKQKVNFDLYKYKLKKKNNEHEGEEKPSRKKMRVY